MATRDVGPAVENLGTARRDQGDHSDPDPDEIAEGQDLERPIPLQARQRGADDQAGRGESQRLMQIGLSESAVLARKVNSFGDPRLFALSVVADRLAHSAQPLVPERMFVSGTNGETGTVTSGPLGTLLTLLLGEKTGLGSFAESPEAVEFKGECDKLAREAMGALAQK